MANVKKGALHRQLGISPKKKIPKTLLRALKNAETGSTITNPTKIGNRRIKVTTLVKKRAVFAWNYNYA